MIGVLTCSAALLVVVAGLAKLRSPAPAATMLTSGWSVLRRRRGGTRRLVRLAAVAEVAVGVLVVAVGGPVCAALLCGIYLVFLVVATRVVFTGPTSCGCFGRAEGPVKLPHLILNACGAGAAGLAVAFPTGPLAGLTHRPLPMMLVAICQSLLLTWLAYLAITALPSMMSARLELETR